MSIRIDNPSTSDRIGKPTKCKNTPEHTKHETPRNTPSNTPWNTQKYEIRIFGGFFWYFRGIFRSPNLYVGLVFLTYFGVCGVFCSVAGSWVVNIRICLLRAARASLNLSVLKRSIPKTLAFTFAFGWRLCLRSKAQRSKTHVLGRRASTLESPKDCHPSLQSENVMVFL